MEGTLLECQQSLLNGRMMAMWTLNLPKVHVPFARQSFARFESQGLRLTLDESPNLDPEPGDWSRPVTLVVSGHFRQGIDHQIRMILESHGARVVQLNQQLCAAQNPAKRRFYSRIDAYPSRLIVTEDLCQALARLAPELDISVESWGQVGLAEGSVDLSRGLESGATRAQV